MKWFINTRLVVLWLVALTFELTSQAEILIIRHGRSRNRHSVEKDHVRWGLKALDNLTIVENHEELSTENETNGELNVVSFYENNGTLSQSSEFNSSIGSYEINYTHSPSKAGNQKISRKQHYHEWLRQKISQTTEIPKSTIAPKPPTVSIPLKKRNGRKKEIMTNIKNTVNKGIQYLKAHENLDEIKIEINDVKAKQRTAKSNKIRSPSIERTDEATTKMFLKQQQKIRSPKQIKINGGKESGFVTIFSLQQNEKNEKTNPTQKLKKSNEKITSARHAASKHIKNHQSHNEMDFKINSDLADVFYIPTTTEESPLNGNDEEMQGDEPVSDEKLQMIREKHQKPKQNEIKSTVAPSNYTAHESELKITGNVIDASSKENRNAKVPTNMPKELTASIKAVKEKKNIEISEINQQRDDGDSSEVTEDFINASTVQNSSSSQENIKDWEMGQNMEINVIDGVDLSDFDETSRNNRKNLLEGKDIVTSFLQIVESQHILGGNCTAGTDLNLGEGVVDQYAQDRFRVEANVAVNRANMLTR